MNEKDCDARHYKYGQLRKILESKGDPFAAFLARRVKSAMIFSERLVARKMDIDDRIDAIVDFATDYGYFENLVRKILPVPNFGDFYEDDAVLLDQCELVLDVLEDYTFERRCKNDGV